MKKILLFIILIVFLSGCSSENNGESVTEAVRHLEPGDMIYEGFEGYYRFGGYLDPQTIIINVEDNRQDSDEYRAYKVDINGILVIRERTYHTDSNEGSFEVEIVNMNPDENSIELKIK